MIPELNLSKQNIDTNGYMYVYQPDHPMAKGVGKVYVHRYVMAKFLNRILETHEHVHHIDGNKQNNSIENLELLHESIHARLHFNLNENGISKSTKICPNCGTSFQIDHVRRNNNTSACSVFCSSMLSRKFNPTKEELEELVWQMPTTKVAQLFGVSDKAIEKRCKLLNIEKPPRGYWRKLATGKENQ